MEMIMTIAREPDETAARKSVASESILIVDAGVRPSTPKIRRGIVKVNLKNVRILLASPKNCNRDRTSGPAPAVSRSLRNFGNLSTTVVDAMRTLRSIVIGMVR